MSSRLNTGIFKRFWRATGGGIVNALFLALAIICIILLIAIGALADSRLSPAATDTMSEGLQEQQNLEAGDESFDSDLAAEDPSGIGNRVNTSQLPDTSFIYDISIEELSKADTYLDGQTVQVTGEVVGDRIASEHNPDYCWITLQSQATDDSEVSVYMSKTASSAIDMYGAYGVEGTTLQVQGTFRLANGDHQGTSEIRAQSVSVVVPGKVLGDTGNPRSLQIGLLLILIGSVFMILFSILRERQR